MLKIILQLITIILIHSQSFNLPVSEKDNILQTTIEIRNKKAIMSINLESDQLKICCKPTRSIFQKIYYFLSNPFFQVYDYSCIDQPISSYQNDTIKLPKLGLLLMSYQAVEYSHCYIGQIGLNKNSKFLNFLPSSHQNFRISTTQDKEYRKSYSLQFGDNALQYQRESSNIISIDQSRWKVMISKIKIGSFQIEKQPIILTTNQKIIRLPQKNYQQLKDLFINLYQCIEHPNTIFCPCETGSPQNYPKLTLEISSSFTLEIMPRDYMYVYSQVCQILIKPQRQWKISFLLFRNLQISFNHSNNSLTINKIIKPLQQTSNIKLPVQLILNCFVILIMCVFVALVLVEIIKRLSGLAQARSQPFRQFMIRRQL